MTGDLNLSLTGNFHDPELRLQGERLALHFDGVQTWRRELKPFDCKGLIQISLRSKGRKGSRWRLVVGFEADPSLELEGVMEDGFLERVWDVPVG
jgi:hypothetical protein